MPFVATTFPTYTEVVVGPWIAWMATSAGSTTSVMSALLERPKSSATVQKRLFEPVAIPPATAASNENTLSPGVTSPWVPSSKSGCDTKPRMAVRSQRTVTLPLSGCEPGVTVTVSSVDSPAEIDAGTAAPVPLGGRPALLRGPGAPSVKSAELSLVSIAPSPLRRAAVVLLRMGVGLVSEQFAVP